MSENKTKDFSIKPAKNVVSTAVMMQSRLHQNETPASKFIRVSQEFLGGRFDIKG